MAGPRGVGLVDGPMHGAASRARDSVEFDAAHRQVEEALQIANSNHEHVYLPQLLMIEAAIARARGDSTAGDAAARRAVAEAQTQQAPWLELLARVELCQHMGTKGKD